MKRLIALAAALLVAAGLLTTLQGASAATNLIGNPSAEKLGPDGNPVGWVGSTWGDNDARRDPGDQHRHERQHGETTARLPVSLLLVEEVDAIDRSGNGNRSRSRTTGGKPRRIRASGSVCHVRALNRPRIS